MRVCGQYDFECKFVYRPSVVIHDALSDRVDAIVAEYGGPSVPDEDGFCDDCGKWICRCEVAP